MSVKQELCQMLKIVYLDFCRKEFALLKQINSQKGNVSLLIGETLASVLACQQ